MNPPPSQFGTAPYGLEPHRGTLILVLGILSLVLCSFFTGIPAWIMGKGDLAKIKDGMMDPEGEGPTKAGMICCIICVVVIGLIILLMILGGGLAALEATYGSHNWCDSPFALHTC